MTTGSGDGQSNRLVSPLIDSTFEETMALLVQARVYAAGDDTGKAARDAQVRLRERAEAFRVTARLANVMAWLLVQRGVLAGEVSTESANTMPAHRLGNRRVCTEDSSHTDSALSGRLCGLLERSHALYCRVLRLDELQVARRTLL